ncbi:hypothetical protein GPALN_006183 [Globodera pallida]|nr:hypothetical protein GPALN_006183 [Globodera pallida]
MRERLTSQRRNELYWVLLRCPIAREVKKWAKWEKEAIEWNWSYCWYSSIQWNFITIDFNDSDIGDG